jgi:hypothetical protein
MGLQTATNPKTGERVVLVDDQWQPVLQSATNKEGVKAYLVGDQWLTDDAPTVAPAAAPKSEGQAPLRGVAGFFSAVGEPLVGLSQGVSKGIGDVMFGGQRLVGMGLEKAGQAFAPDQTLSGLITGQQPTNVVQRAGKALQLDAEQRKLAEQEAIADIKKKQPFATGAGELTGEVVGTLPVGGAIAAPLKKAAQMAPSLARFLTPVATAIESGGFQAPNLATRAAGGAITGGASAGLVDPNATEAGAAIGAFVPTIVAPLVKKGAAAVNRLVDIKGSTLLDAVEGKGKEIVNALRDKNAIIVPGSAPTAGEVAAPVGSTRFSALQEKLKEVPGAATDYATQAAQSNQARLAQESRVGARFQRVIDRVKTKIDNGLGAEVSPREIGESLLGAAKAERDTVKKGIIEPAYQKAFTEAGDAKIDVSNVVGQAESILGRKLSDFASETAPETVRKLLSFKPKPAPDVPVGKGKLSSRLIKTSEEVVLPPEATLQQLDDVRKAINADIAAAKTSAVPTAGSTLRNLHQLHDAIDDAIGKSQALPDTAKVAYADAVNLYRTEFVPRFKTGINANLFKQTSLNEPKLNADDVITKFFQPKGEREAGQFVEMFGKNPDAMKAARTGIEDLYRQKVTNAVTGEVTPAKHAQFMKDYKNPISILDDAGMNLSQRFEVVGKDAARLAKIREMADASGNKLAPPLPPGSNALVIEKRINELTKNLDTRQLEAVNAVRDDLARAAEYQRLAKAGRPAGPTGQGSATEAAAQGGLPFPSLLSTPITIFNNVVKRLSGQMDEKVALELARELSSPALAADAIEKAMARQAGKAPTSKVLNQLAQPATTAAAQTAADQNNLRYRIELNGMAR